MNDTEIERLVLQELEAIAPEVDGATLVRDRALRLQVDLDSIDWLNFLIALHERTGVDIPEADYARLGTLADLFGYLRARLPPG